MQTSRKRDFRKLKIPLVGGQRPQCPSLSPRVLLVSFIAVIAESKNLLISLKDHYIIYTTWRLCSSAQPESP